jgi:tRNA G10  N-methylase Trm11
MIKSVYDKQDDILRAILSLHCPEGFECDLTYGNGSFWKTIPAPHFKFDITPLHEGVQASLSSETPLPSGSLNNAVFDPPFITYVKGGRAHGGEKKMVMSARFGGYWAYSELEQHYKDTLMECGRILKRGGVLVFKCQDIIHNHRMHCTHASVIEWARHEGFRLLDLFVLAANSRIPRQGQHTQKHARIFHSYFLVFKKL